MKVLSVILIGLICMVAYADSRADSHADCRQSNEGMDSMEVQQISLLNGRGKRFSITAHIADDAAERAAGYQHICPTVIEQTFILFAYQKPIAGKFHMNNVKAPLDIAFFDQKGVLISVQTMLTYDTSGDISSPLYHPNQPFQFALEARAGFLSENNFTEGLSRLMLYSIYD